MIDLHRMRVFRAVVASGSVQAAAVHLGYTPSAISQQIAALQRETGLTLFAKDGRGIVPTPAGRALARESDEVMGSLSRLESVVETLRDGGSTSLSIGCFASAGQRLLPGAAKALALEYPDVILSVSLNEDQTAAPQRPDIDIRTEDARGPAREIAGYQRFALTEEPCFVVLPVGHRLTQLAEVPVGALAAEAWVDNDFRNTTCTKIVSDACTAAGFTPRYVARPDDHHTAISFVSADIGITVVPALAVPRLLEDIAVRPLVEPDIRRRIVIHIRDGAECEAPVQRAHQLLSEATATPQRTPAGLN